MATNGTSLHPDDYLDQLISFPDGSSFERIRAITDYRRDPGEARILYLCRPIKWLRSTTPADEYVLKVKVQVPPRSASDDPNEPLPGPSESTAAEWRALQMFGEPMLDGTPHLIAKQCTPQSSKGPFPGGYIVYTVMTKMPGLDLMTLKFWSQDDEVKEAIRNAFLVLLKQIWRLDIAPYDCALRNILWDGETRKCSIVDFEHYRPAKDPINMNEREEMMRWGIVQRPPPSHWAIEWGIIKEPGA